MAGHRSRKMLRRNRAHGLRWIWVRLGRSPTASWTSAVPWGADLLSVSSL